MRLPRLFFSFRTRLLLVMALLLIATLGVQYYLNRLEQHSHAILIAEQEQALAASTALALKSITSREYMFQIDDRRGTPFLREQAGRVMNVMVVDREGNVDDSLDPRYMPETQPDGAVHYTKISDVPMPELVDVGQITTELRRLVPAAPVSARPVAGEARAVPIPVDTSEGQNYIIVVLSAAQTPASASWVEELQPFLPTLAVLLLATTRNSR